MSEAHVILACEPVTARASYEVRAPWSGEPVGRAGLADDAQLERAIDLAARHFAYISQRPAYVRRELLLAVAQGLDARRDALAETLSRESAKPITLARAEVQRAVITFTLSAEESTRLDGELLRLDHAPAGAHSLGAYAKVAAGPVLAITPFNFPLNLVAHKLGPAFAVGAPVVLKPAPQTPLTAFALAAVVREAVDAISARHALDRDAMRAILSVVPCEVAQAESLVRDPRLPVLSFTGSAAVGWHLRALAPKKRVVLELGGNAAAVIAPDGDLDRALDGLIPAAFGYAGQVCIKTQRIYVPRARFDEALAQCVDRAQKIPCGDPSEGATVCGPLIDERAAVRVRAWIDEAVAAGATVHTGGGRTGNRIAPCVVTGAAPGMKLHDEEIFGPVLTLHPYDALDEAWAAVNASRYGLQASVYTRDLGTVSAAFRALAVGAVVVNEATTFRVDGMPYGGVKDSGAGREGVRYAIDELCERKLLVLKNFLAP